MKQIPLTQGLFATVDDCDYDGLSKHKWCANRFGSTDRVYAVRGLYDPSTQKTSIVLMHRDITGAERGKHVDHINHDGLDNRRENLRVCTVAENCRHRRGLNKNSTTGYRGVTYCVNSRKYIAQIMVNRENICIGRFDDPLNASMAYQRASEKYFGEYAGAGINGKV